MGTKLIWLNRTKAQFLQLIDIVSGKRISDHYFYKWLRTKNTDYLDKYLDLTTYPEDACDVEEQENLGMTNEER